MFAHHAGYPYLSANFLSSLMHQCDVSITAPPTPDSQSVRNNFVVSNASLRIVTPSQLCTATTRGAGRAMQSREVANEVSRSSTSTQAVGVLRAPRPRVHPSMREQQLPRAKHAPDHGVPRVSKRAPEPPTSLYHLQTKFSTYRLHLHPEPKGKPVAPVVNAPAAHQTAPYAILHACGRV